MQDLRLIGVHEDGEHLLLSDADGGRFRVRVDEPLRSAVRHDRPRLGQQQVEADAALRPRDVQALIRAGSSAEEVAERSGWSVEKVRRYEGPIVAEREHVAGLSRGVRVRGRSVAGAPTLSVRVGERLKGRGVDPAGASWDAWREEGGPWTVVVTFAAGGRQRQASWHFDLADRTVTAVDDEARWLSEEEEPTPGPIPAPHLSSGPSRTTTVYDVEAEGGVRATQRPTTPEPAATGDSAEAADVARAGRGPEPLDLMTAMRERSTARGRRRNGTRRGPRKAPTNVPGAGEHVPDDALPLEDMAYDPETMPPPPAAHAHPEDPEDIDPLDARPEPEAAAWAEAAGAALDTPGSTAGTQTGTQGHEGPSAGFPAAPDEAVPDTAPDTAAPDAAPDTAAPDTAAPDTAAPDTAPDAAAPDTAAAEAETAEVLESVQSLEAPHRSPEPPADEQGQVDVRPATASQPAATVEPEADTGPQDEVEPEAQAAAGPQVEDGTGPADEAAPQVEDDAEPEAVVEATPAPAKPAPAPPRRNGRPSVPSWDDIMFGARPGGRS